MIIAIQERRRMVQAGARLGDRYLLREPVARGGMGEVWRADDIVLGRPVAVKVLLSGLAGDPDFAERFRTEARAMATLSDPNIVEVYDYGQVDGLAYIVMQFVPGEPLHALLRRPGALPPARVMHLVAQAARALHHAHLNGIVHRDVKPGNLLVRPDGRLVLTDFGIARIVTANRLTAVGEVVGTPSYLSPEQVNGDPVGPATDVYALGVVAYECLALRLPFVGETPVAVALMHTRDVPPPLPPAIPEPVRQVVMTALAKDPRHRFPTAAAMAQAATAAAAAAASAGAMPMPMPLNGPGGPRHTTSTGVPRRPPPSPGRLPVPPVERRVPVEVLDRRETRTDEPDRRTGLWIAAIAILVLIAGGLGWALLPDRGGREAIGSPPTTTSSDVSTLGKVGPGPVANSGEPSGSASASSTSTPTSRPTQTKKPGNGPATATTTSPATPGPNQVRVPNVIGKYEMEADYMIYSAGLNYDVTYVASPDKCAVIAQNPAPDAIADRNSIVHITVARTSETCQPV